MSHRARSRAPRSLPIGRLTSAIAAGFVCTRTVVDPDLWGHLRFGLDWLHTRTWPGRDPYSFTQGVPWVNHEWLSETVFAAAYRAGGAAGMVIAKAAILLATFAVLRGSALRTDEPYRSRLFAAGVLGVVSASSTVRPQLWTLLGLALLFAALERSAVSATEPRRGGRSGLPGPRALYSLPLLFAVWANLHGGWIVGAGAAALWLAGRALDRRDLRPIVPGIVALGAGLLATAANPYGAGLWTFLATTVRVTRNIVEWRPLWEQDDVWFYVGVWLIVALGVVTVTLVKRWNRITWAALLPVMCLGVMSLLVTRLLALFGLLAPLLFANAWRAPPGAAGSELSDTARASGSVVAIEVAVLGAIFAGTLLSASRCLPLDGWWTPDVAAAGAFESPTVRGRLLLPFNWGEYAIFHWGPRLRVSIDGRRETVYAPSWIEAQAWIVPGRADTLAFLARQRPEYVWLPSEATTPRRWLRDHAYRIDIDTGRSFIARRADSGAAVRRAAAVPMFPVG